MSVLVQIGEELNGWVTAVGGVAVVITISVVLQKLHERRMRKLQEEQVALERRSVVLQERILAEMRLLNRGGRR